MVSKKNKFSSLLNDYAALQWPVAVTIKNRFTDRTHKRERRLAPFIRDLASGMTLVDKRYRHDEDGLRYTVLVEKVTDDYVYVRGHKVFRGLAKFNKKSIKNVEL